MTRVVALSGSLRTEKSNTTKILKPFLEGMEQAGASVELFYAKRLNLKPCVGDFSCWNTTPGECHIKDSMQELYPKLRDADILVLATPVYVPLPAEMQTVINRLVPLIDPIRKQRNGRTRVKFRSNVRIGKFVLVASSGWWEMANFGTVLRIVKELAEDCSVKFAGALLRPHVNYMEEMPEKAKEILEAARQAGYELVKNGKMPRKLLKTVSQPLTKRSP